MKRTIVLLVLYTAFASNAGILNTISCPDCGKNVSTRAALCPQCGCGAAAIAQAARVAENAALLPPEVVDPILGPASMGQVGRIMFIRDKNLVCEVVTNGVDAYEWPNLEIKKKASQNRLTILSLQKLEFTFDQIYTMRMELIQPFLQAKRKPRPVRESESEKL